MLLDVVLLLIMVVLIAFAGASGLVRSLVMLLIFYVLCLLLGMGIVGLNLAQTLGDAVITSIGEGPRSPIFYQSILFVALLIPFFIVAALLSGSALENSEIKALRWGDNVLGTLVGVALALAFAAVVANAWGAIVSTQWQPVATWTVLRSAYEQSVLRPLLRPVLAVVRAALFPFSLSKYPIFLIPQG
ncbi:MAG: hypothetical protein MUF84_05750 [Anaerolineae bacterium]|jgi:hypothetical protein|nr:hypothetical protein [Anaerolineae bacterium]